MSNCTNRPTPWSAPVVVVAPPPASSPAPAPAVPVTAPVVQVINPPVSFPSAQAAAASMTYRRPVARKPVYARSAGQTWSTKEEELVSHAYKTAGLQAAYNAVPHRSHPAVRGWLQRRGLIAKTPAPVATV